MRITTSALLAALALGGAAYAQQPTVPPPASTAPANPANRFPVVVPNAAGTPSSAVTPNGVGMSNPASTAAFTVGDVVELKSGSPHMTVIAIGPDVQVLWYSADKGVQRERFPAEALEKTDLNEPDEYAPDRRPEASAPDRGRDDRQMNHSQSNERMDRSRRQEGGRDGRYEARDRDRVYWGRDQHRRYYHDDQ